jgi:hypothetical protein
VKSLIEITLFLGKHSLAFKGHRKNWRENIRGNFKNPFEQFHLCWLYIWIGLSLEVGMKPILSLDQNNFINSFVNCIKKTIIKEINESKYFSISKVSL